MNQKELINEVYKGLYFLIVEKIYQLNKKITKNPEVQDLSKLKKLVENLKILIVYPLLVTENENLIISENLEKKVNINKEKIQQKIKILYNNLNLNENINQTLELLETKLNNILKHNTKIHKQLSNLLDNKENLEITEKERNYLEKVLKTVNEITEKIPNKLDNLNTPEIKKIAQDINKELNNPETKETLEEGPQLGLTPGPVLTPGI